MMRDKQVVLPQLFLGGASNRLKEDIRKFFGAPSNTPFANQLEWCHRHSCNPVTGKFSL